MKDDADSRTGELIEPPKRGRGRPKKEGAMSAAERKRKQRETQGTSALLVEIPTEILEAFKEKAADQQISPSEVITKLICSQYLRKR